MPLVNAGPLANVPPGSVIELRRGDDRVAICNVAGTLHAVDGTCPHSGGPLAHGALHGAMLVCPWHAWEFDCTTGEYDRNPDLKLARFDVREAGGEIVVQVP